MRNTATFVVAVCVLSLLISVPAFAQRAPAPEMWAVGGSIGASLPTDPSLKNGLDVALTLEGYLTSRVSVRGQLGGSWWDITGRHFTGTVKPLRLDGNLVYNWEGGAVHPYVTAGVGMYRFRSSIDGAGDGSDTKAGVNLGGGVEYFVQRRTTVTGEVLYHKVGAFNAPVTTFNDGSFWSLDIGLKAYLGR